MEEQRTIELKDFGYETLMIIPENNVTIETNKENESKINSSEFSISCYCDCGCACHVTG